MADPLSGIAIIICIAFGVLTFLLLFIFANRQIKRFSLKSKSGPHMPIAQDVEKAVLLEINRRLDIVKNIFYQPPLLNSTEEDTVNKKEGCDSLSHVFRMKALDSISNLDAAILAADRSRCRSIHQDYRVFLIRLFQSGVFEGVDISTIHGFADLYELARHEPGEFTETHYTQFMNLMSELIQSISTRSPCRQPLLQKSKASRSSSNGKVPAVPSVLQVESSSENVKATYETSV